MITGRPPNTDRAFAVEFGYPTYEGAVHARCGTTTRYTIGCGCVHCARIIATEQREARKYLKLHARQEAELDTTVGDGLEDDAEARHQASIDEFM